MKQPNGLFQPFFDQVEMEELVCSEWLSAFTDFAVTHLGESEAAAIHAYYCQAMDLLAPIFCPDHNEFCFV